MYNDTLVPAKYTDGQVVLFFNFWNLGDGCGDINPVKSRSSSVGYYEGVSTWSLVRNRADLKTH